MRSETYEINGVEFTTTQFQAMDGFTMLAELIKVAGPAMAVLTTLDPKAEVVSVAPQLMGAMAGLDPEVAKALALKLLRGTYAIVDGRKVDLLSQKQVDKVFNGKLADMFQVLGKVIAVNFSDFFGGSVSSAPATNENLDE